MRLLVAANIGLLVLFPVAWAAPLMRAGLLPLFGLSEISVFSGLAALWESDRLLAVIVALFAIAAPYAKTLALLAVQIGRAPARLLVPLQWLGRLAMADVFLIAIYITVAKGVGVGRIETAWGLYLFTALILASIALAYLTERRLPG
jgi:uncharacterized paraquat-inducible protein A